MIRNYLSIALRNFLKQKTYTLLNVIGLAVGLSASLLVFQYVKYERSFDSFHPKLKNLYRIQYDGWQNGKKNFESALTGPPAGPALKNNFPEVVSYARFLPASGVISYESQMRGLASFYETKMFFGDGAILSMFAFPLLKGDSSNCLQGVHKVVISEKIARKYFGDEEPISKRIKFQGEDYEVTGIFHEIPENSHIRPEFIFTMETLTASQPGMLDNAWGMYDFYIYVLLRPNADVASLQSKWNVWLENNRRKEWDKDNSFQEFLLRPVSDIHLYSNLLYESLPTERREGKTIDALSLIAIFILAIAWINYINLATARAINRANEVGVRKVVGATRQQLIGQFMMESALINLTAIIMAAVTIWLTWDSFSNLTGWNIPLDFLFQPAFWGLLLTLFFGGTFISGIYPAIVLSSFKPIQILKGKVVQSSAGGSLRKYLVVFQFGTSIFLIIGSVVVYNQLTFMKNQKLGVDISKKLVLRSPAYTDSTYLHTVQSFKDEVTKIPGVETISLTNSVPGDEIFFTSHVGRISGGPKGNQIVTGLHIDDHYLPSFNIEILEGRNFDHQNVNEEKYILINKTFLKDLEFPDAKSAIGQKLRLKQSWSAYDTLEIVGVVDDFHHMSLKEKMAPMYFRFTLYARFFALKIDSDDYQPIVRDVEAKWASLFPGNPFDYFILDDFYNHQYDKDDRFGQVFNLFTGFAILIALLGLFGLASFMALQRTKEIGIRKVLGASVSGILLLLAKGFLQPIAIANLVAWPVAWYVMGQWLEGFPYRTSIQIWVFILSGFVVLIMAGISVSVQTFRAAITEPVKTLKHE